MIEVSVVMPAYNSEDFIKEAIDSIIRQSLKNKEIIVVDDGSTDRTAHIAKSFGDKVEYIFQHNQGAASARNRGIKAAKGKYIAFLDADDMSEHNRLKIQAEALNNNERSGMVYSSMTFVNEKGDKITGAAIAQQYNHELFLGKMFTRNIVISISSVMAQKSLIKKLGGFDENIQFNEDYDFCIRMGKARPVIYIDMPLVKYRRHSNNISIDREGNKINEAKAILKHDMREIYEYVENAYQHYADAAMGGIYIKIGDYKNAHKLLKKFISNNPDNANGHFMLGCLFYLLNEKENSAKEFLSSLKAQSDLAEARNNLGVIYAEKGMYKEAERELTGARKIRRDYRDPKDNLERLENSSSKGNGFLFTERVLRETLIPFVVG